MKIKISYTREEAMKASLVLQLLQPLLDDSAKIKEENKHPPYRHTYIAIHPPKIDKKPK